MYENTYCKKIIYSEFDYSKNNFTEGDICFVLLISFNINIKKNIQN